MKLFDPTLAQLESALDVRMIRHNVLAGNLANADTPGYVAQDLDFARAMAAAVASPASAPLPSEGHIPLATAGGGTVESAAVLAAGGSPGHDGNSVDTDRTLAALAENGLQYGAAAKTAARKLAILRYVASDGAA
ncbi:flagellar basal body rod protein FlgB [Vulgatibacter sp.]|uniref:flagellar basal body rod protein FlgB n=1 Tax=Vulgatibacter sp. TaxID=1971226 RepID=UPI003568192E